MIAGKRCPSCGAPFDGKECRQCLYVPFDGDTAPVTLHRRPTAATPTRPQAYRTAMPPRRGRGKFAATFYRALIMFWVLFVIVLVVSICAVVFGVVSANSRDHRSHEEEYSSPQEFAAYELYSGNGIRLLADWSRGPIPSDMYCEIENSSDQDLAITTKAVSVNGMMLEGSYLYCNVESGETESCTLWSDEEELARLGIQNIETVSMVLEITESDTYDLIATTELLTFGPGLQSEIPRQNGLDIYDDHGLKLYYQDMGVTEYGDRYIQFYGENTSGSELLLIREAILINGLDVDLGMFQIFYPDTAAVFRVYLYDFQMEEFGDWELEDLKEMEMHLWITPDGDYEREASTGPIHVPLGGWQ